MGGAVHQGRGNAEALREFCMPTMLDRETYDRVIAVLIAIENTTFVDKESAIKIALGEIADIWPNDIDDDVNHDDVEKAA